MKTLSVEKSGIKLKDLIKPMKTIKIKDLELSLDDEQIKELQAQLAEPVNKRWKPNFDEYYCLIYGDGSIGEKVYHNDKIDSFHYSIGNVFKTEEEAEQALKTGWVAKLQAEQRIKDYILEKGYDTNVDWSDENQTKYYVFYAHHSEKLIIDNVVFTNQYSTLPHFVNESEAEDTMQHCEADYKLLLEVE